MSVLTTNHNYGRWLRDTLDSVHRQIHPSVEHVVVDNGSTDDSVQILGGYPSGSLLWKSGPDLGQARALNVAFRMSSGDVIGWLSSDDVYYDEGVVSAAVEAFDQHPDAALVYGHAVLINGDGNQLQAQWVPPMQILGWQPPPRIIFPAVFLRRSALGSEFVDESLEIAMDTALWLRLRRNHSFVRLDRILAGERHHPFRKSYLLNDLSVEEVRRLGALHGSGAGGVPRQRHRAWDIAYRLAGIALLPRIQRRTTAFDGKLDSRLALLQRQVLVPRSRM